MLSNQKERTEFLEGREEDQLSPNASKMSTCSYKAGVPGPPQSESMISTIHQFPSGGKQKTGCFVHTSWFTFRDLRNAFSTQA